MFGSLDAPVGAPEMLHAMHSLQNLIFAIYNSESGKYQEEMQERLDAFIGQRSFKDTLSADKSQVMRIICDPEGAFGDRPPRQGWAEFKMLCHFAAEAYSYSMNQHEITQGDELAVWINCFAYGCLVVDMVEMGFFDQDDVINKYFIQVWWFLPKIFGSRPGKVPARQFLAQVQEK